MIRPYRTGDLQAVVTCFHRSVREIGERYYTTEQVEVWAPDAPDLSAWASRLGGGGVFVAEREGDVAGFVRVEETGFVDLLYVHPNHERRGLGRELLEAALTWAEAHGVCRLESEVSMAARPLFEAMGFHVVKEQSVERKGIRLRNFRMVRSLRAERVPESGLSTNE